MKKKLLSLLLFPLILTSCGEANFSLDQMREKLSNLSDEALYPIYKVVGTADFDNLVTDVDAEFHNDPGIDTFVPYSRYNTGFYNMTADISEADPNNIIIYSLASKSYWLRAPLRITKSNFYQEVYSIKDATLNNEAITINNRNYEIGEITLLDENGQPQKYLDSKIKSAVDKLLTITAKKDGSEETSQIVFTNQGEVDESYAYAGTFKDANNNVLVINKGSRENTTCAHYLIQHIITSYLGQTGSTNPSKNQMRMEYHEDGSFSFIGDAVHSIIYIDNLPYYPDPAEHPEVGEWDPEYPIPCYKNKVNAKVNIRFDYNAEGWLVKESMSTIDYNYDVSTVSQCSVVAVYGYKFN